jgi:hypothetical protein
MQLSRSYVVSGSHLSGFPSAVSRQILSTAEEKTLLKVVTRLSKLGYPITLLLIRDLTKEIRLLYFYLSLTLTSYSSISKR